MQALDEPVITRHRLTVAQYHRMAEAGVLEPDARVELIEGEVIDMAPMGSRHFSAVARLNRLLIEATGAAACVSSQMPLHLGEYSEPEPDLAVLKPRPDFYARALPKAGDALLVIEVADSTLAFDLRTKARLYAVQGVPAYWVLNLAAGVLHVHSGPAAAGYAQLSELRRPGVMALPGIPGASVDLSEIW